jgi:sporulation protein YlmC with PRC-barrel domain
MKIFDDLKGKEVIDDKGNKNGNISDIEWNPKANKVEYLIVTERRGPSAAIGRAGKKIVPYEKIHSIGDKIILKAVIRGNKT